MSEPRVYSQDEFIARGKNPPQPTEEERRLIRTQLTRGAFAPETPFIIADWLRVDVSAVMDEARALGLPVDPTT